MEWSSDFPTTPGFYWFYGDPFMGAMGQDYTSEVKVETKLYYVEVHQISNGLIGVTSGQFMPSKPFNPKTRQGEGYIGMFLPAQTPQPPNIQDLIDKLKKEVSTE